MSSVHIFASQGRFTSLEAIREFIDPTYTEDGDQIDSDFIREVGIDEFEPMCIEVIHSPVAKPLKALLENVSYSDQWLPQLRVACDADAAICIFEPNVVLRPESSSLRYCGMLSYNV
jgi:hypothetical protein